MILYNLVNMAALKKGEFIKEVKDFPSYIKCGSLPFSRIYLVSKDKEKARIAADQLNKGIFEQNGSIDFRVQQLSQKGKLRFYRDRYFLGNLSLFLGDSMDLDSKDGRIQTYMCWKLGIKNKK